MYLQCFQYVFISFYMNIDMYRYIEREGERYIILFLLLLMCFVFFIGFYSIFIG